ncbi:hypothetical protein FDUTEX481_07025 [Tolypothrix sp. PCC 7601]|nr:hypothetical protein FDUTEX481_07025 [Tolypothrix sp. PCC 7601]
MRGWVGVEKVFSTKIAETISVSGFSSSIPVKSPAHFTEEDFQRFWFCVFIIAHVIMALSAQQNLENFIHTGFGASAIAISLNPY